MPPSASSNLPILRWPAPGEGPLFVAEQFAFQQVLVQRAAVHGDDGLVRTGAQVVDQPGQEFLARAAFALDQHRGAAGGHPACHIDQLLHFPAPVDDPVRGYALFPHLLTENLVFPDQRAPLGDAVHQEQELVKLYGLRDVIDGAGLHGIHGRFDRPVGGHDHHVDFRVDPLYLFKDLHAVHARHLVIEEDDIELVRADALNGLVPFSASETVCPSLTRKSCSIFRWDAPSSTTRMFSFLIVASGMKTPRPPPPNLPRQGGGI